MDVGLGTTEADVTAVLTIAAPTILLSVPGLLIILAFAAQLAGGLAWIPVVRRSLDDRRNPRRAQFVRRTIPR